MGNISPTKCRELARLAQCADRRRGHQRLLIVDEFVNWLLPRDVQINEWRRESLPCTRTRTWEVMMHLREEIAGRAAAGADSHVSRDDRL